MEFQTALIGLFGVIAGALLTGLIGFILDQRRRYDREIELIIAVHPEIVAGLQRARISLPNATSKA